MPRTIKINISLAAPRNHEVSAPHYDVTCHYMSILKEAKAYTEVHSDQTFHDYSMDIIVKKILSKAKFNDNFIINNNLYPDLHKQFKQILEKELDKPNYKALNITITNQSDILVQANRSNDAYEEQEKILHRAQSAIKKITRLLWPIHINPKIQDTTSSKYKILEKVHDIEENLRITQLAGTLILLAGVILFLVVAGTPFSLPLVLTAIGVTLIGSLVLASASGIGYKTGIFKAARENQKLSDDFLTDSMSKPAALANTNYSPIMSAQKESTLTLTKPEIHSDKNQKNNKNSLKNKKY